MPRALPPPFLQRHGGAAAGRVPDVAANHRVVGAGRPDGHLLPVSPPGRAGPARNAERVPHGPRHAAAHASVVGEISHGGRALLRVHPAVRPAALRVLHPDVVALQGARRRPVGGGQPRQHGAQPDGDPVRGPHAAHALHRLPALLHVGADRRDARVGHPGAPRPAQRCGGRVRPDGVQDAVGERGRHEKRVPRGREHHGGGQQTHCAAGHPHVLHGVERDAVQAHGVDGARAPPPRRRARHAARHHGARAVSLSHLSRVPPARRGAQRGAQAPALRSARRAVPQPLLRLLRHAPGRRGVRHQHARARRRLALRPASKAPGVFGGRGRGAAPQRGGQRVEQVLAVLPLVGAARRPAARAAGAGVPRRGRPRADVPRAAGRDGGAFASGARAAGGGEAARRSERRRGARTGGLARATAPQPRDFVSWKN
ncbi:MAG: hypothetical protein CL454_00695 [Acidimicrobiaceae bacterium]|nr:hypothetical protein [Acidimicrobiaceae bacterium]